MAAPLGQTAYVMGSRDSATPIGRADGRETKGLDDDQFARQVRAAQEDAVMYIDGFISPDRALAQSFYLGNLFGNEEEGRSQVVMTVVRDVVLAMIPELLRIFAASGKIVEFEPTSARTEKQADQQTDFINHIFWNDNPGFSILHNGFKDALTVRTGIFKWRWSDDVQVMEADYENVSLEQLIMLQQEDDTEILKADMIEDEDEAAPDADNMAGPMYSVRIRRKKQKQRAVIECIPPEEFIIARDARDVATASYVGHRSLKTISDLVEMGYDRDEVEALTTSDETFYRVNLEAVTRNPAINQFSTDTGPNSGQKRVVYVEQFIRIDKDGDGIAELRKVCSVGYHILHDEIADEATFAVLCPDPTPHMVIGQSIADQTMDLQLIMSSIVRDVLDSLKQSINPRTWVVEGQVNIDDVLNNEVGGVVRMRQPGMAGEFSSTFVGQQAMPMLAYMDQIKEKRTGISSASQGLDPDVLQSTTADAVTATIQGAQARIEMIARLFAENGLKALMKGLQRMVIKHQDRPRVIRLRGEYVEMDPRFWDADLDCHPAVALGRGTDKDKMQFLTAVAGKQEQIIQLLGPTNPLADIGKYRETLAQICHLAGFKDDTRFFGQVDPQQVQQAIAAQAQNKPQDPTAMLAEIEKAKVDIAHMKAVSEAQAKQAQMQTDAALQMEKMRLDAMTKIAVAQINAGGSADTALIENMISRDIAITQAQIEAETAKHGNLTQALTDAHIAGQQQPEMGSEYE